MICDFCQSPDWRIVYQVQDSPRLMEVGVCQRCGLVQSQPGLYNPKGRTVSLSSGADWGNVRHGKGLRLKAAVPLLDSLLPWNNIHRVLDVGSNRGDFVRWLGETKKSVSQVVGVEPDATIVDNYKDCLLLQLHLGRFENVVLPKNSFDLVYCFHTLEHADSAAAMLQQISSLIKKDGYLFLEVPNIDLIKDDIIVEELFIDKHRFHFNRSLLCAYLVYLGFKVSYGADSNDMFNITLVATKVAEYREDVLFESFDDGLVKYNEEMIHNYSAKLIENRQRLKKVAEKLASFMKRQRVAFWGAGRIFDALIRYGGLGPERIVSLVDDYLYGILPNSHHLPIRNSTHLKIVQPDVVIVLAKSSAEEIASKVRRLGVRNVIKFQDLMDSVR